MFESILQFFHAKHTRDVFLASCLSQFAADLRGWNTYFNMGPALFEGGRSWGVLQEGVRWILQREVPIRRAWSCPNMLRFGRENDREAQVRDSGSKIQSATEAIESAIFWSFLHLLKCLTNALDGTRQWMVMPMSS